MNKMIEVPVEDLELVMALAEEFYEIIREAYDPKEEEPGIDFEDLMKDREALVRIGVILKLKEKLQR